MAASKKSDKRSGDLREACIQEALAIVGKHGIQSLSLREVARRLGVSHQAPYKHFRSRDHILAEIVSRAYTAFAEHLEARPRSSDAHTDLEAMGRAYIEYALTHPLQYELMFGNAMPDPAQHPDMMKNARHAFALLQAGIRRLHRASARADAAERSDHDALFVWSVLHGACGIMHSQSLQSLGLPADLVESMMSAALERVSHALQAQLD